MKNYSDIIDNESKIKEKSQLVDETIDESKLTQHEVIAKMFEALVNEIESPKKRFCLQIFLLLMNLRKKLKKFQKLHLLSKLA